MKKYKLTENKVDYFDSKTKTHHTLFQIEFLIDLPEWNIKAGDLGGYIEKEWNLSQEGLCIVKDEACVLGMAMVRDNAGVFDYAVIKDSAVIEDEAQILDNARVFECARISMKAVVRGVAKIHGFSTVGGNAIIRGKTDIHHDYPKVNVRELKHHISGDVLIEGDEKGAGISIDKFVVVEGYVYIYDNVTLTDNVQILEFAQLNGEGISISGYTVVEERATINGSPTIKGETIISGNTMIRDNPTIESSKLHGYVEIQDSVIIKHSFIKGNEILLMHKANINSLTIQDSEEIIISDEVNIKNVTIKNSKHISMKNYVDILFLLYPLNISATNVQLSGSCRLRDNLHLVESIIIGENIVITDCVQIGGSHEINSDFHAGDFATFVNRTKGRVTLSGGLYSGDLEVMNEDF